VAVFVFVIVDLVVPIHAVGGGDAASLMVAVVDHWWCVWALRRVLTRGDTAMVDSDRRMSLSWSFLRGSRTCSQLVVIIYC
jgi:hypothetical protein